jgi:hypothetical protein
MEMEYAFLSSSVFFYQGTARNVQSNDCFVFCNQLESKEHILKRDLSTKVLCIIIVTKII